MKIKLAVLLAAVALAAPFSAPSAQASPGQDQRFWDILIADGIIPGPQAVRNAHLICSYLWSGRETVYDAVEQVYLNNNLSYGQSETFVAAAISVYCPPDSSVT